LCSDSNVTGRFALYTTGADGDKPRRLTTDGADDAVASWSPDRRSIYFASDRSDEWQVWKMPADGGNAVTVTRYGGNAVAVTRYGGYVAHESNDGRFVYYSKGRGQTSLWRVPAEGGEEQQVLESVDWQSFAGFRMAFFCARRCQCRSVDTVL